MIGVVGAGLALAVSEDLRKKVLDALFGAEEEFEYTSTTAPATPAPERRERELGRRRPARRRPFLALASATMHAGGRRSRRPSSFYSPAMKSRTSTSAPGRASVSRP